jgi:hypothetical protein
MDVSDHICTSNLKISWLRYAIKFPFQAACLLDKE